MYAVMFRYKNDLRWNYSFADPDNFDPETFDVISAEEFIQQGLDNSDVGVFSLSQARKLFLVTILDYNSQYEDCDRLGDIKISKINHYPPYGEVEVVDYREFK